MSTAASGLNDGTVARADKASRLRSPVISAGRPGPGRGLGAWCGSRAASRVRSVAAWRWGRVLGYSGRRAPGGRGPASVPAPAAGPLEAALVLAGGFAWHPRV